MSFCQPVTAASPPTSSSSATERARPLRITVYSCEPDEAEVFDRLSPRFGVLPTLTSATVSDVGGYPTPRNRCISVGHKSELPAPTLRALKDAGVEYISTRSIGVDHIDLDAAEALGITVENVVYAPDGVADFTVMLMLMAIRDAPAMAMAMAMANRHGGLGTARGRELRDMTVGVVGVGRIGGAVVQRLQGFGCRVLAHRGSHTTPGADDVSLAELLRSSDVVTLHLPLTADTFHLIGRAQIDVMKDGAVLVNTARGSLVDTDALIIALEQGRLGGAALDVLEGERGCSGADCPQRADDGDHLARLRRLPNTILTPHVAYYTGRALHEAVESTMVNCVAFARGRVDE